MNKSISEHFLWVEKYRPATIDETVLPPPLKNTFLEIVKNGELPNMLFTGSAGTGKTTVAKALCRQLGLDYIMINGSEEGNIDTLRGKIKQFASSVSLSGGVKVVILDEADYLNPQSTQPALRGFIEEFSNNCRFILTCNFKNRIIEPLHSRCGIYEFNTSKKDLVELAGNFYKHFVKILDKEGIPYKQKIVADLIMKYAPDWRRVMNEAQRLSLTKDHLTNNISSNNSNNFNELVKHLKEKNFKNMRKWVVDNMDIDTVAIFRGLYDNMNETVEAKSIPQLVLILAEYQYKNAFVADHELNTVACFTEIMANVEFK